ncbi:hypothetical protein ACIQAC_36250 [Streptomyces sp. NPDC088387]|uniref:hypothetical protein n=1 Tax=Streptomyces sp. NPDC088387 TaxID=3365859 RepID=UPI00382B79EE
MHGHGYPQPVKQPPPTALLVFLRVVFVVISILSLGFLTWTMMLRLAIVTRKSLDWGLFAAVVVIDILAIVLLGSEPGEEIHTAGGWTGLTLLLGTLVAVIAYYLAADIRHFQQLRQGAYAHARPPAYGYPQAQSPYTATTVPQVPPAQRPPHTPSTHHTPPPATPAPPPQRPAPARIDQVRAELDELSEFLRKQDGRPEGGR